MPVTIIGGEEDRGVGALVGLAIGDALGTTLEFSERDEKPPVVDMVGGGPFGLQPGEWTDDTAMAMALAISILNHKRPFGEDQHVNCRDLIDRFVAWYLKGKYSVNGKCFDIGTTTRRALDRYRKGVRPLDAGLTDESSAGNGSLMRAAPVAIRWFNDIPAMKRNAPRQSRVTHGHPAAMQACTAFTLMLGAAIRGLNWETVMMPSGPWYQKYDQPVEQIINWRSWKDRTRSTIQSSGYVAHTLEAALWAVANSGNFRDAVLLAVNLGDDADTVGAVTGQLAGAIYGYSKIPVEWRKALAKGSWITEVAYRLIRQGKRG